MNEEIKPEILTSAPQLKKSIKKPMRAVKSKTGNIEKRISVQAKQITALGQRLVVVEKQNAAFGQIMAQVMATAAPAQNVDVQSQMINTTRSRGTPPQLVVNKPPVPSRQLDPQEYRIAERMRTEIAESLQRGRDRPPGAAKQ